MILSGTLIGCDGTTTAFANIWPEALKRLLDLSISGRYAEAQSLQEQVRRKVRSCSLTLLVASKPRFRCSVSKA